MNKTLSVSKKVYSDVTDRINSSLSGFPASAREAMRVVDTYLAGGVPASSDPLAMLAFNMIKVELDRAMERSARARERARARKMTRETADSDTPQPASIMADEENGPAPIMISRRERRAMERACNIKKKRWGRIDRNRSVTARS